MVQVEAGDFSRKRPLYDFYNVYKFYNNNLENFKNFEEEKKCLQEGQEIVMIRYAGETMKTAMVQLERKVVDTEY